MLFIELLIQLIASYDSKVRNYGIKKAKGKYICFNDSDDIWNKKKLESQIDTYIKIPCEIGFLFGDLSISSSNKNVKSIFTKTGFNYWLMNNSKKINNNYYILPRILFWEYLILNYVVFTPSIFIEKKTLIKYGCFNEKLTFAEDNDLWLKISKKMHIACIDTITFNYMQHNLNMTIDRMKKSEDGLNFYINYLNSNLEEISNYTRSKIKVKIIKIYILLSILSIYKKDFNNFFKYIFLSFKFNIIITLLNIPKVIINEIKNS
jgi:hypothetical protein